MSDFILLVLQYDFFLQRYLGNLLSKDYDSTWRDMGYSAGNSKVEGFFIIIISQKFLPIVF